MKLFIPKLGTRLVLSKPWTFKLHDERRNEKFWLAMHGKPIREEFYYGYKGNGIVKSPTKTADCPNHNWKKCKPAKTTLPKGTVLTIERIYIRKGGSDFDSISFRVYGDKTLGIPSGRFWVGLNDVNNALDATAEVVNKWPEGKFYLNIVEGKPWECQRCKKHWAGYSYSSPHYCSCSDPLRPAYVSQVLG